MKWISYRDLAERLAEAGLPASARTLRRWVKRHRIPVVRVNHRVVRIHGPTVNRVIRSLLLLDDLARRLRRLERRTAASRRNVT